MRLNDEDVSERELCVGSREEQEKLNVWVALLNLENMYGTEESLKKVFERALQFCEPMPVYQQLADIYTKSDKIKVQSADLLTSTGITGAERWLSHYYLCVHLFRLMFISRRQRACIR